MECEKNQLLLELENIVGEEWVSDEPEIIYAHCRDANLYIGKRIFGREIFG